MKRSLLVLTVTLLVASVQGQESVGLADAKYELGCLVHFTKIGKRIRIDQGFWGMASDADPDYDERQKLKEIQQLVAYGQTEEMAEKIVESKYQMASINRYPAGALFKRAKRACGAVSGGGGGDQDSISLRGRGNQVALYLHTNHVNLSLIHI